MPEENSIFMKTSSRALGILTQLHSETAQAMYAYTVGRQQGANEMALSNAILAERLIGCYRVIPLSAGFSPCKARTSSTSCRMKFPLRLALPRMAGFPSGFPRLLPRKERGKGSVEYIRGFWALPCSAFFNRGISRPL